MTNYNNIYKVYTFEVEHTPSFTISGGTYNCAGGFAMGKSLKKAMREARKMFWSNATGGTPIMGGHLIMKGNNVLIASGDFKAHSWFGVKPTNDKIERCINDGIDMTMKAIKRHNEERELNRLIAEEQTTF